MQILALLLVLNTLASTFGSSIEHFLEEELSQLFEDSKQDYRLKLQNITRYPVIFVPGLKKTFEMSFCLFA